MLNEFLDENQDFFSFYLGDKEIRTSL